MNKLLTTIALLCFSVAANAQQPDWVSLEDAASGAFTELDSGQSKKIYVFQRCAGHYLALSEIFSDASEELEAASIVASSTLSQVATFYKINLELQRTGNVSDVESESKIVLDVVVALYEKYMSWLNNNYITQGSYFEKDQEFQQEMQLCKVVAELASSIMMDI